jgi:hypothetical protein
MELTTLIEPADAEARLAEFRAQIREERTTEDAAIAAGLRAAARGNPVIDLTAVMTAGGVFDNGLPRLAIVRADAKRCWVSRRTWLTRGSDRLVFSDSSWDRGRAQVGAHRVEVVVPTPPVVHGGQVNATTIAPLIPPRHRPRRTRLHNFHVLWEVEKWDPTPPRDPALLRHIRGNLWSVLATWDLTELERAVLSARVTP